MKTRGKTRKKQLKPSTKRGCTSRRKRGTAACGLAQWSAKRKDNGKGDRRERTRRERKGRIEGGRICEIDKQRGGGDRGRGDEREEDVQTGREG
jgi:hypothetical protein